MIEDLIRPDPAIVIGKPVIKGIKKPVELILKKLSAGESPEQVLSAHPRLTSDGIRAAWAFAARALRADVVYPAAQTAS